MFRSLLLSVILLLVPAAAIADFAESLYGADIKVADQRADIAKVAETALAEVLIKISGSLDIMEMPSLLEAKQAATSYVQRYGFISDPREVGGMLLHFQFNRQAISELLAQAGAPFWTVNRPSVLVWLAQENGAGRQLLNSDNSPELLDGLKQAFIRRGVDAQFPLHDLEDAGKLSAEELWQFRSSPLRVASGRYRVEHILAGRFALLTDGSVVGDWRYITPDSELSQSIRAPDTAEMAVNGANFVADTMAAQYATVATKESQPELLVEVQALDNYLDYAAIVNWLEKLEVVEYVNVAKVEGDDVFFNVRASVDLAQLAAIISLNSSFIPIPGDTQQQLTYQWKK